MLRLFKESLDTIKTRINILEIMAEQLSQTHVQFRIQQRNDNLWDFDLLEDALITHSLKLEKDLSAIQTSVDEITEFLSRHTKDNDVCSACGHNWYND